MLKPRRVADLSSDPPAPHLIGGVVRDQGSVLLFGATGLGKTRLVWQLACAWAKGESIFGLTPRMPLRTLFVEADMFRTDFEELIKEMRIAGVDPPSNLAWFARDAEEIFSVAGPFAETVSAFTRAENIQLTIFDAVPDLHAEDPNEARVALNILRALHRLSNNSVYLGVMVQRKADRKLDQDRTIESVEDMLGSQGWGRQAATIWQLTGVPSLIWTKHRLCKRPPSIPLFINNSGVFSWRLTELVALIQKEAARGYSSARELAKRVVASATCDIGDRKVRDYIADMEDRGVIYRK